ncbi:MAG: hypothetical protein O3C43_18425 [Verrucomicrobia bacterium]|nr:hypothetical protein [Verrucomicrobiota bacterium]
MSGSEELYDLNNDPEEWTNLSDKPDYATVKSRLKSQAPDTFAPMGTPFSKLKVVFRGETFHWEPKR